MNRHGRFATAHHRSGPFPRGPGAKGDAARRGSPHAHLAPLGADLLAHLERILGFNRRPDRPTAWELDIHAGPDFLGRLRHEAPGQAVVLAGRNRRKIDYLEAALAAGMHVLADKPWIIDPADLPRLKAVLDQADDRERIAYDIMTERFEISSILQRELIQDPATFGDALPGSAAEPSVYMESVHFLKKQVAGVPLRRPAWFFDITQQGEGLSDVGTHLVDLVMWMLFPELAIDRERDLRILAGRRWPTTLTADDLQQITGEASPSPLDYFCNNQVDYSIRGIHVKLDVLWGLQAEPGAGDTHRALFRGSRSSIEVRQGRAEARPELYVVPNGDADRAAVTQALAEKVQQLQGSYPGITVAERDRQFWVQIPERYRIGHEAHFAEVTQKFLHLIQSPQSLPAWEKPNMLAKYFVTTQGVAHAANR